MKLIKVFCGIVVGTLFSNSAFSDLVPKGLSVFVNITCVSSSNTFEGDKVNTFNLPKQGQLLQLMRESSLGFNAGTTSAYFAFPESSLFELQVSESFEVSIEPKGFFLSFFPIGSLVKEDLIRYCKGDQADRGTYVRISLYDGIRVFMTESLKSNCIPIRVSDTDAYEIRMTHLRLGIGKAILEADSYFEYRDRSECLSKFHDGWSSSQLIFPK